MRTTKKLAWLGLALPVWAGCADLPMDEELALGESEQALEVAPILCGPSSTPPRIHEAKVTGPLALDEDGSAPFGFEPTIGRLTRGDVHYVSSGYLSLRLELDACSYIQEVRVNGSLISTTPQSGAYSY